MRTTTTTTASRLLLASLLGAVGLWACAGDLVNEQEYKDAILAHPNTVGGNTTGATTTGTTTTGTNTTNTTGTSTTGASSTTTGGATYPACALTSIQTNCAISGCHNTTVFGINMSNPTADGKSWVGHAPTAGEPGCAEPWIDPTDYTKSLIWDKINSATPAAMCGQPMPFGKAKLPPADITCFMQFLQAAQKM